MDIATKFNSIPQLEMVMNALIKGIKCQSKGDEVWKNLPWPTWTRQVSRIQRGIYKAARQNDNRKVKRLQTLMLRSRAAQALSVRQVTQLNSGKKTPGVDGKTAITTKERLRLCQRLRQHWHDWEHQKVRKVEIPKPDGRKRLLGIPTIADRAWQALMKYALEPIYEAQASPNSYGFRPGRSAWDAQQMVFLQLRGNKNQTNLGKWVLELDIEGCFDNISYKSILKGVRLPRQAKEGVKRAIKAGVRGETPSEIKGTPQGGVISPLLANIAIGNIEDLAARYKTLANGEIQNFGIPGIRYADDLVFITRSKKEAELLLPKITEYLSERGLRVKEAKTHITKATEGFDFLGWHFKVKSENGVVTCSPCRQGTERMKTGVKETMKLPIKMEARLRLVGSKIRGYRNYHKWCCMDKHNLWHLSQWVKRRIRKELGKAAGKLAKKIKTRLRQGRNPGELSIPNEMRKREAAVQLVQKAFPKVPSELFGHIKVKYDKSPFDGDLVYWTRRKYKEYAVKSYTGKAIIRQGFRCRSCHMPLMPGEEIELHHIDGNHSNNKHKNHAALHRACHQHQEVHKQSCSVKTVKNGVRPRKSVVGGAV